MNPGTHKRLSSGIVILNTARELLLCHVTGHDHWDLPKGCVDDGETPLQAALRETWEETGLVLHASQLTDLGRHDFRPRKQLHLYAALMPRVELAALSCRSHFMHPSGRRLPEMDDYRWQPITAIAALCRPRMAAVLDAIDLQRLHQRLCNPALHSMQASARAGAPPCIATA